MARKPKTANLNAEPQAKCGPAKPAKQPVKMTEELFERILERIADGAMLMRLEQEDGMPTRGTVRTWVSGSQERREAYDLARLHRADAHMEMLSGINAKLLEGTIDPQSARALSDNLKWAAKVDNPKVYGDRSQVDLNVSRQDGPESVDDLRARIARTIVALPLLPSETADEDAR